MTWNCYNRRAACLSDHVIKFARWQHSAVERGTRPAAPDTVWFYCRHLVIGVLLYCAGPSSVRLALVDQPWFVVTLIICVGCALWLAMCVVVALIIGYRRRRKPHTSSKYADGRKPGKASTRLRVTTSKCNKKLSCRRETARCFMSLNISLSYSRLLKVVWNNTLD